MKPTNYSHALGTIFSGKYRLDRFIGSGGMGEVYAATHIDLKRSVAIKTLKPEYAHNEKSLARFQQEARLAGSIGHEHICEVTDIGKSDIP